MQAYIEEPSKRIPVAAEVDVIVVGGGPSGLVASVAAARNGASTVLIERYGFLGGMATAALVGPFAGVRHRYGGGRIVGGIPWELIRRLAACGGALLEPMDCGAGMEDGKRDLDRVGGLPESGGEAEGRRPAADHSHRESSRALGL